MNKKISILAGAASLLLSTSAFGAMITSPMQEYLGAGMNATGGSRAAVANSAGGAPPATDLGVLNGDSSFSGTLGAPDDILWYTFEVVGATYLDITFSAAEFDTEIGLFSDLGALLGADDDDGFGLESALSFGTGSGLLIGDFIGTDVFGEGQDGPLAAGVYYLAIGEFNTVFADGFGAENTGTVTFDGGDFTIDLFTDSSAGPVTMSEPMSLLLVGFGLVGVAAVRRRRS